MMQQDMTDKLTRALPIDHLDVINESQQHNVPRGAESHFKIVIVSEVFEGKTLLARHRLVHSILADTLATRIHALALHTMTNEEWSNAREVPASPPCRGGGAQRPSERET
jgi:BolA protein